MKDGSYGRKNEGGEMVEEVKIIVQTCDDCDYDNWNNNLIEIRTKRKILWLSACCYAKLLKQKPKKEAWL